ncbi:MAG TPA: DUF177 domain-containing protein [Caulobacteraceae bacterium]|nr:DUF177 domain-containing protein [Caulobacteraceae bacterium]
MAQDRGLEPGVPDAWPVDMPLHEVGRAPVERRIIAEGPALARIAEAVGVDALKTLDAALRISPWLDGVEIHGLWSAEVTQTCGVSLEPFDSVLAGDFTVRAVPTGSALLGDPADPDLELDPEADDPPDEISDGLLHLGAYVVEDLSLAVDPFPRKPDAVFAAPDLAPEPSPFAVLSQLKAPKA